MYKCQSRKHWQPRARSYLSRTLSTHRIGPSISLLVFVSGVITDKVIILKYLYRIDIILVRCNNTVLCLNGHVLRLIKLIYLSLHSVL